MVSPESRRLLLEGLNLATLIFGVVLISAGIGLIALIVVSALT